MNRPLIRNYSAERRRDSRFALVPAVAVVVRTRALGKDSFLRGIIANLSARGIAVRLLGVPVDLLNSEEAIDLSFSPGHATKLVGLPARIVYHQRINRAKTLIGARFEDDDAQRLIVDFLEETTSPQLEVA